MTYTVNDFIAGLKQLGIARGDLVHVHSALFPLGRMSQTPASKVPESIYHAFRHTLGEEGTLTVAASFDDYARFGVPYDCRKSPVDAGQGIFSQYVASLSDSFRTYSPMSAIAGVGPLAKDICHQPTATTYGTGSAWEKLYEHDAKFCFVGLRPHLGLNYVLFAQFRFGVPHCYNKIYTTPIYENGKQVPYTVTNFVRYLRPEFKIGENSLPFEQHLEALNLIQKTNVGRGHIYMIQSARQVFQEATRKLQENIFYFCPEKPHFIPGEVPMDGPTGKYVDGHWTQSHEPSQQ